MEPCPPRRHSQGPGARLWASRVLSRHGYTWVPDPGARGQLPSIRHHDLSWREAGPFLRGNRVWDTGACAQHSGQACSLLLRPSPLHRSAASACPGFHKGPLPGGERWDAGHRETSPNPSCAEV